MTFSILIIRMMYSIVAAAATEYTVSLISFLLGHRSRSFTGTGLIYDIDTRCEECEEMCKLQLDHYFSLTNITQFKLRL